MDALTLEKANEIISRVFKEAIARNSKPLTVAVLDKGGAIISLQRQNGTSLLRPEIATGKAWGALALGISSRKIADDAQLRPSFIASATNLANGKLIPAPGGILIRNNQNHIIGAIGITGDTSDTDEALAIHAVLESDLQTDN